MLDIYGLFNTLMMGCSYPLRLTQDLLSKYHGNQVLVNELVSAKAGGFQGFAPPSPENRSEHVQVQNNRGMDVVFIGNMLSLTE